jgi:hypothetical protein
VTDGSPFADRDVLILGGSGVVLPGRDAEPGTPPATRGPG